jgi:hypothetical protein
VFQPAERTVEFAEGSPVVPVDGLFLEKGEAAVETHLLAVVDERHSGNEVA